MAGEDGGFTGLGASMAPIGTEYAPHLSRKFELVKKMQLSHRIFLIAGLISVVGAAEAMPTGAFLRKPAYKVSDLISAVRTDPIVADRYVRHFRMNKAQLVEYFSTLSLSKLDIGGAYTVYNVHDSVLRSRVLNLKKGTLVFSDSSGRPILQQVCGNPMVWRIPPIAAEPIVSNPASGDVTTVVDEGTAVVVAAPIAEPGVAEVPVIPPPPPMIPPTVTRRNDMGLLLIPLVLGVGALTLLQDDDDCPPVPEPATMTALVVGGAALLKRRKKK